MRIQIWALGLLMLGSAVTAQAAQDVQFKPTELADGFYLIEGEGGFAGGNMALSIGDDGVMLIDSSMPQLLPQLQKTIGLLTRQPVNFLINTHVHGDHTGNNQSFGESGSRIIGHHNVRQRLQQKRVTTEDGESSMSAVALPVMTFSEEMRLYLNGHEVRLIHLPNAHTDGDVVVWWPALNIIHVGDVLFNGMFPFVDLDNGGTVQGYLNAQQQLLNLVDDNTKIIAGHGPMAGKADLQRAHDMLLDARKQVARQAAKGKSEDEAVQANPLEPYQGWSWSFIPAERMVRTLYRDLMREKQARDEHHQHHQHHGHQPQHSEQHQHH